MKKTGKIKLFSAIIIVLVFVLFITNSTKLLKKPSSTFVVEKGSISYEETTIGYLIRDEVVLEESNGERRDGTNKVRRRKSRKTEIQFLDIILVMKMT